MNKDTRNMNKDTRKPFDLARAKAGDPIETRNGMKAVFGGHNSNAPEVQRIAVWVDGVLCPYFENGKYSNITVSARDLFMSPKKIMVWVNVWRDGCGGCGYGTSAYATKEIAESRQGVGCLGPYPLEIDAP